MELEAMSTEEVTDAMRLMWAFELTKKEAIVYVLIKRGGMTRQKLSEELNCTRPLISKRLKAAKAKVGDGSHEQ